MPPSTSPAAVSSGVSVASARPLALVECGLLRADRRLAPLDHVAELLTTYLDGSVCFSLEAAASSGSVRLFLRVAARIVRDDHVDSVLREFWFAKALWLAIKGDDLPMIQTIHAFHPDPLRIHRLNYPPSYANSSLRLAFRHGSLAAVQWTVENRSDGLCCPPGVENLCRGCLLSVLPLIGDRDPFDIVMWLVDNGAISSIDMATVTALTEAMEGSIELVRWVRERGVISDDILGSLLEFAIHDQRVDDALYLIGIADVPSSPPLKETFLRCLITAVCWGLDDVVAKIIDGGYCDDYRDKFE